MRLDNSVVISNGEVDQIRSTMRQIDVKILVHVIILEVVVFRVRFLMVYWALSLLDQGGSRAVE